MEELDAIAWQNANHDDLWIFDKLIVARKLGYICGPQGMNVPKPDFYIVRPCVNIPGMSRGAKTRYIMKKTHHLPSGHFWCEIFKGRHISVDYKHGEQILAVEGFRESSKGHFWQFCKWQRLNEEFPLPELLKELASRYEYLNIEYVDGKVIEIHLRHNPDFVYGQTVAYPVWKKIHPSEIYPEVDFSKLHFIKSPDYKRLGFYIDLPS